jgi:crotonobetainyl-CoA:carnitine CoA-transferase CaiB-like acyl-CoA transferase
VQFETFATQRIRGAMLDELRGNDWMSRGDRRHQRSIESAVHKLEQRYGRAPTESEIAAEMGLSLSDYQVLLGKVRGTQLIHLEDMSGDEGDDPIRIGLPLVDVSCGMCAAFGILAAIMHWRQTGAGQKVETALIDAMFNLMATRIAEHAIEGREPARAINLPIAAPSRHFRAGDGRWFSVSVVNDGAFKRFCDVVGHPEWVGDPRYATNAGRVAHRPEMATELAAIFSARPAAHWVDAFGAADIPCGPVNTVGEAMADPVLAARVVHRADMPGLPFLPFPSQLSVGMRRPDRMAPPPRIGQHSEALLRELGVEPLGA